jgi:hypothetical protein
MSKERISGARAKKSALRLINSHFGNADPARVSIPAQPTDDDITIMAYIEQAEARRVSLQVEEVRRMREIIQGFLDCPEISDCHPEDKDAETEELESRARSALSPYPLTNTRRGQF